jgi:selenophosphate synthase
VSDELALVSTLDFFTPIVDDPYQFGQIACANALSDVYAMGCVDADILPLPGAMTRRCASRGRPVFALNIVGFPTARLSMKVLERILQGSQDKAREAGVIILGGHSIEDLEPKFGLAVTGYVHPQRILRNAGAQAGDVLVLTKPIGTGILSTALKRGLLSPVRHRAPVDNCILC